MNIYEHLLACLKGTSYSDKMLKPYLTFLGLHASEERALWPLHRLDVSERAVTTVAEVLHGMVGRHSACAIETVRDLQ